VQTTSTEVLKSYIFNEPIVVSPARLQPIDPAAIFTVRLLFIFLLLVYVTDPFNLCYAARSQKNAWNCSYKIGCG